MGRVADDALCLTPEAEARVQEFFLTLEWSQEFSLYFIFTSYPTLLEQFRARLDTHLRHRTRPLRRVPTQNPVEFVVEFLERVRSFKPDLNQERGPIFLEVWEGQGEEWETARRVLLGRINELRDRLRQIFPQPFIFVFPKDFMAEVKSVAPDLWDVRSFALTLDSGMVTNQRPPIREMDLPDGGGFSMTPALAEALIAEWDRVAGQAWGVSVYNVGTKATDAAIGLYDFQKGVAIAQQMVVLAREAVQKESQNSQNQMLLALSLSALGNAFKNDGALEQATQAYQESIDLARSWQKVQENSTEWIWTLSISHMRFGDLLFMQEDWESARKNYAEALELILPLRKLHPNVFDLLSNHGLILSRLGDVYRVNEAWSQAEEVTRENLLLRQQLIDQMGESPELLRNLWMGHLDLGKVLLGKGALEGAESSLRVALSLIRRLFLEVGDSPRVIHDLSSTLWHYASCIGSLGRLDEAIHHLQEGLRLAERLTATFKEHKVFQELAKNIRDLINAWLPTPPP